MHYTLTQSLLTILIFFDVFFVNNVNGLASTDTITWGGSNDRTGYQNNHNMDPAIVGSAQFGLLFKTNLPGTYLINGQNVPEQIFSQPLVYTGSDDVQYVYVATTQNNVYKINAKSGVIVASRNLHRPFLVSDLNGCVDINPTVGVTATGVIDPDTVCMRIDPSIKMLTAQGHLVYHSQDVHQPGYQWSDWPPEWSLLRTCYQYRGLERTTKLPCQSRRHGCQKQSCTVF